MDKPARKKRRKDFAATKRNVKQRKLWLSRSAVSQQRARQKRVERI